MRSKSTAVKEDPQTAALRAVEEARAAADKTSAMQGMLDRRTRRMLRIFGKPIGFGSSSSGVVATQPVATTSGSTGGGFGAGSISSIDGGGRGFGGRGDYVF